MAQETSIKKQFDLQEFSLNTLTRENVQNSAQTLKFILYAALFLLIAYTVWFCVRESIGQSPAIEKILKTAQASTQYPASSLESPDVKRHLSRKDIRIIKDTKLFGGLATTSATPTPKPEENKEPLNLTLIGTISSSNEQSVAILEDKKGKTQEVFKIGESVFEQGTLKSVSVNSVDIERGGEIETLTIDDTTVGDEGDGGSSASIPEDAEEVSVDSSELDSALENLPLLLTQARAVPYFKQGKSVGLRLFAIKTGSLYEKIGLKNGDILKTINGESLGDFSQAMKLFETLKQEETLALTLERNRADKAYHYTIE